jgi:hypothetical protein
MIAWLLVRWLSSDFDATPQGLKPNSRRARTARLEAAPFQNGRILDPNFLVAVGYSTS